MHASRTSYSGRRRNPWAAAVAAFLILWIPCLSFAAASPHHHDAAAHHDHHSSDCLICAFVHAKFDTPAANPRFVRHSEFRLVAEAQPDVAPAVSPAFLLPPACGPPALA
jgi:hypothetical protein